MSSLIESMKNQVALKASSLVQSGMIVGLGTGTTVNYLLKHLGEQILSSTLTDVQFVCSSNETETLCNKYKIPFNSVDDIPSVDLYIDGADEITLKGLAIKGLGGALTREKLLRLLAKEFIVIITSNKLVDSLGEKAPIPIEILQFGQKKTIHAIEECFKYHNIQIKEGRIRKKKISKNKDQIYITDNGNIIVDNFLVKPLEGKKKIESLNNDIKLLTGVIETGLFVNPANMIISGDIRTSHVKTFVVE